MENKEVYLIPRNLNKPDIIIHRPISLNWKEIGYLCITAGGIAWSIQSDLPTIGKIAVVITTSLISILGTAINYEGSTLDEVVLDFIRYKVRKLRFEYLKTSEPLEYRKLETEVKNNDLTFNWEESTERKVNSIQPSKVSISFKSFVG